MKSLAIVSLLLGVTVIGCGTQELHEASGYSLKDYPWSGGRPSDADAALNSPGVYAWKLFLNINRPGTLQEKSDRGKPKPGGHLGDNGPTIWEGWKHPSEIFLSHGATPGPFSTPVPIGFDRKEPTKEVVMLASIRGISEQVLTIRNLAKPGIGSHPELAKILADVGLNPSSKVLEAFSETRINPSAFKFVYENHLFKKSGLVSFWQKQEPMSFERTAIEIKARWIFIGNDSKDNKLRERFHVYSENGNLYGLASLHIITKDVPQWFWCTFEHVDNTVPFRSEDLAAPDINPENNSEFVRLAGSRGPVPRFIVGTKWQYYRLRGTQTAYNFADGEPSPLDNTKLEQGFVFPSSCMSCHGRSRIGPDGHREDLGITVSPNPPGLSGPLGPPDPRLFRNSSGSVVAIQSDFTWIFRHAQ